MKTKRKRLGDLLVESGLITEEQLAVALKEKKDNQKLGDALLDRGFITEQQLIEVLEFQLGIPHVSLYRYPVDIKLLSLVSKEMAKKNLIIPLKKEENRLFVAMADPMDYFTVEDLRLSTGFQIETAIAAKQDILRAVNKYYDIDDSLEEFMQQNTPETAESQEAEEDSPVVRLVNQIMSRAMTEKASDIHIDPHETKVVVRMRVDGVLQLDRQLPKSMLGMLTARIKIMANMDITEHRIPQDGRIKTNIDFRPIDIRISTLPTVYGEKIVMRILDLSSSLNDMKQLGFNKVNLKRMDTLLERPNGIVLITGPTGSGKSSTLYAGLNQLNSEEVNIITVEDPVEYQLEGVNQIQVNPNVGLTFAAGLRSILRQDPNVIMVGEIRDKETAEIAIRASLTGHLVLSTLHTNDSISSITRLIDMGVEPFLVASSLSGIVAQRLIRKVCRDCRHEEPATEREKEIFGKRGLKIETINRGKGCASCNMTGYKGRVAIHEVLTVTEEMKRLILNNEPLSKLKQMAMRDKTIFLLDDGLLKIKQGITTTEEVLRAVLME
ncbi:Flp pilus assembly complex ATPase component TadA [Domibacillus sp. A3M-37]|uniref:GspE/PulE family protein n=1 Tax=Domibacillus TaxID=1433999 RepID=UPI000617C040|nr:MULTISPECIES: ATPase, T2SS/T4P/T4SS family [Domibacillus]MCP3762578.1 Flp pilus assembly complex ATPase component TadA [Domibacillus sp. A3M-37]